MLMQSLSLFGPETDFAPTPLDPTETTVGDVPAASTPIVSAPAFGLAESFRHSGWARDRQRTYVALIHAGSSFSRIMAFAGCGDGTWILRNKANPELFRAVPDHCHDRLCVPCSLARQSTIQRNLESKLDSSPKRFITLTVRSDGEALQVLLDRLYRAFRLLRSRAIWKDRVQGGCFFLEVTYSAEGGGWHPHLHIIAAGKYFDRQLLSREWLSATGDSERIDIKLIRDRRSVIRYVTKYATKVICASVREDLNRLAILVDCLHGRRMVQCFGSWLRWKLLDNPADEGWEFFGHVNDVRLKAIDGDPLCENIISMIPTSDLDSGEFTVELDLPPP